MLHIQRQGDKRFSRPPQREGGGTLQVSNQSCGSFGLEYVSVRANGIFDKGMVSRDVFFIMFLLGIKKLKLLLCPI